MVVFKIDRRGGRGQKSFSRTDPKYVLTITILFLKILKVNLFATSSF